MSAIALAETVDRLVAERHAFVVESETAVTVSGLDSANCEALMQRVHVLRWTFTIYDSAGTQWTDPTLEAAFGPFRLVIVKPVAETGTLRLLTNGGFAHWLQQGHEAPCWQVAGLTTTISTLLRRLEPWVETPGPAQPAPAAKSPRSLVREYTTVRLVPDDVRPWLATAISFPDVVLESPAAQVWVQASTQALLRTLPDEIDPIDGGLRFRGPPRLALAIPASPINFDRATFDALQRAVAWVFEHEREAEMRHILLAAELARSASEAMDTTLFLKEHLTNALEAAQLGYQVALADTTREALKLLSDLRKAVVDETGKLNDISRQLAVSVAGALATCVGLVVARVTADTPLWLNAVVATVVILYVAMTIGSGLHYVFLQRRLRTEWQPKLYRFLPTREYSQLVAGPIGRAERGFFWVAWVGGIAVTIIASSCFYPFKGAAHLNRASAPTRKVTVASLPDAQSATRPSSSQTPKSY